jgi:hypothetical protein
MLKQEKPKGEMFMRSFFRRLLAGFAWLPLLVAQPALAQDYPLRPIRVIVTTSPGGISDIFVRALGERLQQRIGQPLVIENRAGGNMIIGARACAEAPPDGYTLCVMPGEPLLYNQFQFKSIPYDPDKSFATITNLFFITQALGVSSALNVKSLDELAAYSKAKAATLSYSAPSSLADRFHGEMETGDRRRSCQGAVQGRRRHGYRHHLRHDAGGIPRARQSSVLCPRGIDHADPFRRR